MLAVSPHFLADLRTRLASLLELASFAPSETLITAVVGVLGNCTALLGNKEFVFEAPDGALSVAQLLVALAVSLDFARSSKQIKNVLVASKCTHTHTHTYIIYTRA